jgi:hypothetical protein
MYNTVMSTLNQYGGTSASAPAAHTGH